MTPFDYLFLGFCVYMALEFVVLMICLSVIGQLRGTKFGSGSLAQEVLKVRSHLARARNADDISKTLFRVFKILNRLRVILLIFYATSPAVLLIMIVFSWLV
jgi:hypothetical protein